MGQKDERKEEKIKKYTLKMEPLGNYLTFRNTPWNRPRKGLYFWKKPKKEPVKVLYSKKGTEEGTGEGSWLWLSLKRPIKIVFEEPLRSTEICCNVAYCDLVYSSLMQCNPPNFTGVSPRILIDSELNFNKHSFHSCKRCKITLMYLVINQLFKLV